jgi:hypothetical protein
MDINEVAHALGKFPRCPLLGDLHLAPRSVRIEEDKQIKEPLNKSVSTRLRDDL